MDAPPPPYPGEILRVVAGSTVNGLNIPGSGDLDLMGVCIEPRDAVLGLQSFEQYSWRSRPTGEPSEDGDVEITVYGLRKAVRLITSGNPTVTSLLFVPPEFRHLDSEIAEELRLLTPYLVSSKRAAAAYNGYVEGQKKGLQGNNSGGRSIRPRERWLPGTTYDTKYAMHMVRLAMQGIDLLETGRVTLPMQEPDRSYCYSVRMGEVPLQDVIAVTERYQQRLVELTENGTGPLREEIDTDKVNDFLVRTYLTAFG